MASVKLSLRLTSSEQGEYPVATESLWCDKEGPLFRVRNIPFFKEALSYGDLIEVQPVAGETDQFDIVRVVEQSGHSTIWVLARIEEAASRVMEQLVKSGCGREGGVFKNLFALNVPPTVEMQVVVDVLAKAEAGGILAVDYPSIRQ